MFARTQIPRFAATCAVRARAPFAQFLIETKKNPKLSMKNFKKNDIFSRGAAVAEMFKSLTPQEMISLKKRAFQAKSFPYKNHHVKNIKRIKKPHHYNNFVVNHMSSVTGTSSQRMTKIAHKWWAWKTKRASYRKKAVALAKK